MNVALFTDPLYMRIQGGISRYTYELARRLLTRTDISLELFSLFSPQEIAAATLPGPLPLARSCQSALVPRPAQYLLWHWLNRPGAAGAVLRHADVIHTPVLLVPPRVGKRLVVTVHDVSFALFPQHHTRRNRMATESGLKRAARDADAFITDAECTADDLVRLAGISRNRIFPVPLAAASSFQPTDDPAVLARYGIDAPFILYVGTLEPRKNVTMLIEAYASLDHARLAACAGSEVKLVIAGKKGWLYQEIFNRVQQLGLANRVIFTGFVPDEDLPALYSGAAVFVYPSLFEGFGLPVLEAMSCGAATITTNVSSLPEVAGDAALLAAPGDVEGCAGLITRVLTNPQLQADLKGRARARAQCFSWDKTAAMTREVYQKVVQ